MKKRFLAAALAAVLLCLLSACQKTNTPASSDSMAGSYHMVDAAGEGSKELLELKDAIRLEVRANNSATLSLMRDVHELQFHPDKKICTCADDDQKVPYTFDGKQIVMDTKPFRMVFER